jgi:hypothetical protein
MMLMTGMPMSGKISGGARKILSGQMMRTTDHHDEGVRISKRYSYDPHVFAFSLFWGGRSGSAANPRSAPCWVSARVPLRAAKQR